MATSRWSPRRWPQYLEDGLDAALDDADAETGELIEAVHRILTHADETRRLRVRANADTADDAARARRLGAQGIGLCRTEHMFLGERRVLIERLVLADADEERSAALEALLPLQRDDFEQIFTAMDGLPVTVRLLDPPLHEFLPDRTELAVRWRWPGSAARTSESTRSCWPRSSGCTSPTRCSGCAGSGWG